MKTYIPYNPKAEEIGFLIASVGYTQEEAEAEANHLWHYTDLISTYLRRLCKQHGHKFIDESYGNPEHGCIAMSCSRCGWSFHETLY
jgi:hypothetical protein